MKDFPAAYQSTAGSALDVDKAFYKRIAEETTGRRLVESFIIPIRTGRAWKVPAGRVFRIVATLKAGRILERTVMTSFQLATAAEVPRHGQPMRHVWLVTPETQIDIGLQAVIDLARSNGVPMLGLRSSILDAASVAQVRQAGLGLGGWACNDAAAIAKMFDLGVDVFTTDRPDLALALRAGRGSAQGSR